MVAFVEPSVRLITEIVASASFSTRRSELSGVTARWVGFWPTVMLQTEEFVDRSNKVTRLGEVAMNATGSGFVKFEGVQAGGAERAGGAKAAKRKNRKKTAREEVEPSWGVIAEHLSNGRPVCR